MNYRIPNAIVLLVFSVLVLLFSGVAQVPPANEGVLTGVVRLVGALPPSPPPTPVKPADAVVCGSHKADEAVRVGSGGLLQNAIVYLDRTSSSPGRDKSGARATVKVTNRDCRFQPRVQAATVGSTLIVGNDDNILHNTHAYLDDKITLFNIGLPFVGVEVSKPLTRPGMVHFKCDAGHTWMNGYLLVLNHAFHAVTDSSGRFRMATLPAGVHRVLVWHEKFGNQTANAEIKPGQETSINVEFRSP